MTDYVIQGANGVGINAGGSAATDALQLVLSGSNNGILGISKDGTQLLYGVTPQRMSASGNIIPQSGGTPIPGVSISPVGTDTYAIQTYNANSEGTITTYIYANPQTGIVAPIDTTKQVYYTPGSPGGMFTGMLQGVGSLLNNPLVGAGLSIATGGMGASIADALGLQGLLVQAGLSEATASLMAPKVGGALLSAATQVAAGQSLTKALQNVAIGTAISTGSTDVAKAINSIANSPTVSNAVGSFVSGAATTLAQGGNAQDALKSGLASSGASTIRSNLPPADSTPTPTPTPTPPVTTPPGNTVVAQGPETGTTSDVTGGTTGPIPTPPLIPTMYVDSNGNPIMTDTTVESGASHFYLKDGTQIFRNPEAVSNPNATLFISGNGTPVEGRLSISIGGDTTPTPISTPQPSPEPPTPAPTPTPEPTPVAPPVVEPPAPTPEPPAPTPPIDAPPAPTPPAPTPPVDVPPVVTPSPYDSSKLGPALGTLPPVILPPTTPPVDTPPAPTPPSDVPPAPTPEPTPAPPSPPAPAPEPAPAPPDMTPQLPPINISVPPETPPADIPPAPVPEPPAPPAPPAPTPPEISGGTTTYFGLPEQPAISDTYTPNLTTIYFPKTGGGSPLSSALSSALSGPSQAALGQALAVSPDTAMTGQQKVTGDERKLVWNTESLRNILGIS